MNLFLGGDVPADAAEPAEQRERAKAFNQYLNGMHANAAENLKRIGVDAACPIECVVFAHALAETGEAPPEEIAAAVARHSSAEEFSLDAIRLVRRRERPQAAEAMVRAFAELRGDPWPTAQVLDSLFRLAVGAANDAPAAHGMYQQLAEPLALHRMEAKRLTLRYLLAERLGDDYVMQALAPLEPHVPWTGWLLQQRARIYALHGHPLAAAAQRDAEQYQDWEEDD
jgi:hypothetical protein